MTETNTAIKADWRILKLDWTWACDKGWLAKEGVKKVAIFYLVDFNSHTHLCEATPSVALFPMLAQVEMVKHPETDEEREKQSDLEIEMLTGEEYVTYMHASSAAKKENKPIHFTMPENEDEDDLDSYTDKCIDYAREELNANQGWPW